MAPITDTLKVFYDGLCPFCVASMERMQKLDKTRQIEFLDLNDPKAAKLASPRFTPVDLEAEMHSRLPDGTWRIGYYAWVSIIVALPRLSWLNPVLNLPVLADLGRVLYRVFAANRYIVSRILRLPAPCDPNGACRIPAKAS